MTRNFVDLETGELIEDIVSIRTAKQDQAYRARQEKENLLNASKQQFSFTERDLGGLDKVLNNKDLGYFLVLHSYMNYSNILKMSQNSKYPMNRDQMQEVLKIKAPSTMRTLLKRLKEVGAIYEDTVQVSGVEYPAYVVNSKYSFRKGSGGVNSKRKTNKAVKIFMDGLQSVYAQDHIKPADIGFLYKLLGSLHYDSNFLVKNPDERDIWKVEFLSIGDIAEITGISREETTKRITRATWNNMYVFARSKAGGSKDTYIKINPYVANRKAGDPAGLGVEFVIKNKSKI